jgi:1-aminocyclopropane-1-carboxylate deaminase
MTELYNFTPELNEKMEKREDFEMKSLWDKIFSYCDISLLTHSRIHAIPSFDHDGCQVFVKREDESGFGISGCKKRKYASLIPFLKKEKFALVSLVGGIHSNHIVGFSQLLRENRIPFRLFLRETHLRKDQTPAGNALLSSLLIESEQLTWISHDAWPNVENTVREISKKDHSFCIPEGGSCQQALPGALTLMHDIIKSERQIQAPFDHIFIDSGTALIAGALSIMNNVLARESQIHVVLMADDEVYFQHRLQLVREWFESFFSMSVPAKNGPRVYYPVTARSFGSVNTAVLKETQRLAMEEGLITDPVYTTKLFMTAREVIHRDRLKGRILIVHSGGGTGLMGFGEMLKRKLG